MKFEREAISERNRAFCWFFAVFSPILMALGLLTGMPWYFCLFFLAFSVLCVISGIHRMPFRLSEDGMIRYFEGFRRKSVRLSDANALFFTEYRGPERRNGSVCYHDAKKRDRLYGVLLSTDRIGLVGKCTDNHKVKPYFNRKDEILFTMCYDQMLLKAILDAGFSGDVFFLKRHYRVYEEEITQAVRESGFDFSKVHVI